ncbi:hypothetical protein F4604DRAFT_147396 [Suillus subluteus]|nr:hypothetical protein F4604DRAFT_147396 [Suillus subluteus]
MHWTTDRIFSLPTNSLPDMCIALRLFLAWLVCSGFRGVEGGTDVTVATLARVNETRTNEIICRGTTFDVVGLSLSLHLNLTVTTDGRTYLCLTRNHIS